MEVDKGDVFDSSAQTLLDMARSINAWPYADHHSDAEKDVRRWREAYSWFSSETPFYSPTFATNLQLF